VSCVVHNGNEAALGIALIERGERTASCVLLRADGPATALFYRADVCSYH
jgi:hypothetical protein